MVDKGTAGMTTHYIPTINTLVAATARAAAIVRDMSTLMIITSTSTGVSCGRIITATIMSTSMDLAATGNLNKDYLVQAWIKQKLEVIAWRKIDSKANTSQSWDTHDQVN
jgi:hypothetical protein